MICVVLSRPRSFDLASWIIRKATDFPASHSSIHLSGKGLFSGERLIFESTSHGTRIAHPSLWDKINEPVFVYEMVSGTNAGTAAIKEMWKLLGSGYDYRGLLHFALRLVASKFLRINLSVPDTPDQTFCSELVARWLNQVRGRLGNSPILLKPDAVSPAGLSVELERSGLFRRAPCEISLSAMFTSAP